MKAETITRLEIADILGIYVKSLPYLEKKCPMPAPLGKINTGQYIYDRKAIMGWIEDAKTTNHSVLNKREDVWNIRSGKKNFIYKGDAELIIQFIKPSVMHKHHKI